MGLSPPDHPRKPDKPRTVEMREGCLLGLAIMAGTVAGWVAVYLVVYHLLTA